MQIKQNQKKKFLTLVSLLKKSDYNAKVSEIEGKIPIISGLITISALTAIENKIPSASNLVKKTDYDTKISEVEKKITDHKRDKYITTPEFNKLIAEQLAARLARANLITKTDFDTKRASLNRRITSNKTKHSLIENKLKKLKHLIEPIFVIKVILKIMMHKIG